MLAYWGLCYLSNEEIDQFLDGAMASLKKDRFLVFAEPIDYKIIKNKYKG